MADVPENIKEIIDAAIQESLSPIMEKLSKNESPKGKEIDEDSNVSDAVKQWLKSKEENNFKGIEVGETLRVGTSIEELKKM